jgi:hypothetical protein
MSCTAYVMSAVPHTTSSQRVNLPEVTALHLNHTIREIPSRAHFSKLTPSSGDVYAQLNRARINLFSPLLPKPTRPEPRRERHLCLNIVKRPAMQPELGHTPKISRFTTKLSCVAFLLSLVFAFMSHAGTYTDIGDILSISRSLSNVPPKTRISLVSDSEIETLRHTLS